MLDFLKKKTLVESRPLTLTESGIALAKTPSKVKQDALATDEEKRTEGDLKFLRNAYNNVPLVAGMINTKTDQIVQDFYFTGPKSDELERLADKVNLKTVFYRVCRLACIFGDSFVEVVKNRSNKVTELKVLNSEYIKMYTDKTGSVVGYGQVIDRKKLVLFGTTGEKAGDLAYEKVVKDISKIAHFKFSPKESGNYGTSMIRPMLPMISNKLDMEQDLRIIVKRYSAPIIHAKVGNNELPAQEENISAVASEIEDLQVENEIVTSHLVSLDVLQFNNKGVDLKTPFEYVDRQILAAGQVPPLLLGYSSGIDRATAEIQLRNFWGHVRAKQQELKVDFEDQIIIRHGLGTPKTKLNWKFADPREKDVEATQLQALAAAGVITKQKCNDLLSEIIDPRMKEKLPEIDFNSQMGMDDKNIPKEDNPNDPTKSTRIKQDKRVTKTDFRSPLEKTEPKK